MRLAEALTELGQAVNAHFSNKTYTHEGGWSWKMVNISQKEFKERYGGDLENLKKGEALKDRGTDKKLFKQIRLTLPYPPTLNTAYATVGKNRVLSAKGKAFKKEVAEIALVNRVRKLTGELKLSIDVFRPRKTGDLDNLLKLTQDSLEGIAYENDRQIVEIHARRFDDKNHPRAEIRIEKK